MKPTLELLIGSPVVGKEAQFLVRLCSDLSASTNLSDSVLVLANFEVGPAHNSRQIDFLIVSDLNQALIELKCFEGPIIGEKNGGWKIRNFAGSLLPYPGENPWSQASQAKYLLSDAMLNFCKLRGDIPKPRERAFYREVDSTVCIFPRIHEESRVTKGDYKAWVKGYDDFVSHFRDHRLHSSWTPEVWRRFALEYLSLRPVSIQQAIDPQSLAASDLVESYCQALGRSLQDVRIPAECWSDQDNYGTALIEKLVCPGSIMMVGPSGCGKSFHVQHAISRLVRGREVPVIIRPAKYKDGDFWTLVKRGVMPFYKGTAADLFSAVEKSGRGLVLVVDGANECPAASVSEFHNGIRAFLSQFGARLLATGQKPSDVPGDLVHQTIQMEALSLDQKRAIYEYHANAPADLDLLKDFASAYDIAIAGQCHATGPKDLSRVALYDRYCRKQLPCGREATGSGFLRELAFEMDRALSLAISRGEFDRLVERFITRENLSISFADEIRETPLLQVDDESVSFDHELLLHYFRAEEHVRRHPTIDDLHRALGRPANRELLEFILPRFVSRDDVKKVLDTCTDPAVIGRVLERRAGPLAFQIVTDQCLEAFDTAIRDLANLSIAIESVEHENGRRSVTWAAVEGNRQWNDYEILLFRGALENISEEEWLTRFLALHDVTEAALRQAAERAAKLNGFRAQAVWRETLRCLGILQHQTIKIPGLILIGYLRNHQMDGRQPSIKRISERFWELSKADQRRQFSLFGAIRALQILYPKAQKPDIDKCLEILSMSSICGNPFIRMDALMLMRVISSYVHEFEPNRLLDIKAALDALDTSDPLVNTDILEVLAVYDALEPVVSVQQALEEFRKVLPIHGNLETEIDAIAALHPELNRDQLLQEWAYGAIAKIFEDIFQGAYWEAYGQLTPEEKLDVLILAAGAEQGAIHKDWIFAELLRLKDPKSLGVFQKFASKFDTQNPFLNESISSFVLSILGCAQFLQDAPAMTCDERMDEQAWVLVGQILFWHERRTTDPVTARHNIRELWGRAHALAPAIPDVLLHLQSGMVNHLVTQSLNLTNAYPDEVRVVLEEALQRPLEISSLWFAPGVTNTSGISFAISLLEKVGNFSSASVLRPFLDSRDFGPDAVRITRTLHAKPSQ